jgi:DMSO/TMAO reductase YedYZ molybdopterin-dependent catalytic subunit
MLVGGWLTTVNGVRVPALAGALAERARGLLPLQILGLFIVRFKFEAKPIGFWTTMGSVVLVCAVAGGIWAARRPRRFLASAAGAAIAVAAILGLLAISPAKTYLAAGYGAQGMADAEAQALALRATLFATAAYALLAALIYACALQAIRAVRSETGVGPLQADSRAGSTGLSRREFLSRSVVLTGALAGAGVLLQWMSAASTRAAAAAQSLFARVRGLPPEVTPTEKFYTVSKNPAGLDPKVDGAKWTLEVGGLVGKPIKLTLDEIRSMPSFGRYHTLECISNDVGGDLISNAAWKGVRFRDLIERAGGVSPKAIRFAFRCADGYTEGVPVVDAMRPDAMLAYEMNGGPLTPTHGFPLRMLNPGHFGMKNPKWITKIEAVSTNFTGYWEASGWSDEAVVKTMSAFRVPEGDTLPAGEVELGGVAYSGDRGIKEVEVSPDGGKTWLKAELKNPLGPYTWVLWAAVWTPTGPGEYTLKVRAKDGTGVVQTAQEAATLPDGASGYHTIRLRVKK